MKTQQHKVAEWMQAFGQEVPINVMMPSLEVRKLRAKLILEEALEIIEGLGIFISIGQKDSPFGGLVDEELLLKNCNFLESTKAPDLVKIADGNADSLVVQLGTAVACGIDIEPIFNEVMRSNWSKFWSIKDLSVLEPTEARKGKHKETGEIYDVTCVDPVDLLYLVKDKSGKVIKSPSYSPANLEPLLT